jgi:hypothetical protein
MKIRQLTEGGRIFHALLATFTIQGFVDGRRMRRESWAGEEFEGNGWSVDSK